MTTAVDINTRRTSDPHSSVVEAWSAVMDDVRALEKNSRNQAQNYDFRGIDDVVNAVGPALRKHRLIVLPRLVSLEYNDVIVGRNNTRMGHARVIVEYTAHHPTGHMIIAEVPGEAMDVGDKAVSKAMSVAERTAYLHSLTLPTHETDPDADSYERDKEPKPRARNATPQPVAASEPDKPAPQQAATVTMRRGNGQPRLMTSAQRRMLMPEFAKAGLGGDENRAARLMFSEQIIGRPLQSSNELTTAEASKLIDHLDKHGANLEGTS